MPDLILDSFGRAARYRHSSAMYDPPRGGRNDRFMRRMDGDYARLIGTPTRREMLSDARTIAKWPLVRGMLVQKADYVSAAGWEAYYTGRNRKWGETAHDALVEADKLCDVRGQEFPFSVSMHIGCQTLDVDWDYFILLTQTPSGWPLFQFIEAHRVASRTGKVQGGEYDGAACPDGIIYDKAGREIAYSILGDDAESDTIVPASSFIHAAEFTRFSEGRGLSPVAYAIHDWYDVKGCRDSEKVAQRANAKLTLIEENERGRVDPMIGAIRGTEGATSTGETGMMIEELEDGLVRFVKSGKGSIKAHESNRPSTGARQFEQDIISGAAFGMQWRVEMMDLSKLTGAGVRGFKDNINTAIFARFNTMRRIGQRMKRYQIAKLIKRGDLAPDVDWWKWDFPQPPEFDVDAGRTIASDLAALRGGIDTEPRVIRRTFGADPDAFWREQARAYKRKREIAREEEVPIEALGRLDMPGDQPAQPQQPQQHDENQNE